MRVKPAIDPRFSTQKKQPDRRPLKILVTGFSPFPGAPVNPTQVLVQELKKVKWSPSKNASVHYEILTTSYKLAEARLKELIGKLLPDVIVQFGLSARTKGFRLERVARNKVNNKAKDAKGFVPRSKTIKRNGEEKLRGTWPISAVKQKLSEENLPVTFSNSAGDYVCNYTYYKVLDQVERKNLPTLAGFVHVPYTNKQIKELKKKITDPKQLKALEKYHSLSEKDMIRGAKLIIKTLAENAEC